MASQTIRGVTVYAYGTTDGDWIWAINARQWRLVTAAQVLQTYRPEDRTYPSDGWATVWHTILLPEAVGYSLGFDRITYTPGV